MTAESNFDPQDLINDEQFEDMRDLLDDDFDDLVRTFITDSKKRLSTLQDAFANNDNAAGFEAAHAMKGASANLGTTLLMTLASNLQEACRNQDISTQHPTLQYLEQALDATEATILKRLG